MKPLIVFFFVLIYFQELDFVLAQNPPPVRRDTIRLYFDLNKADLSQESKSLLDTLFQIPSIKVIRITAYTDFLGAEKKNLELSQKRSENTKSYLLGKKFPENKIAICQGMGVHDNSSEANRINKRDRGIREHRLVEVVYVYEPPKPISKSINTNKTIIKEEDIEVGANLVLENIIFIGNHSVLVPGAEQYLYQLLEIMKKYPSLKIEIQGHICCRPVGQDGYDYGLKEWGLSTNRARVVYSYLLRNGIDAARMTYKGYGSSHKLFPEEKNQREMDLNKRVEIKIVEK